MGIFCKIEKRFINCVYNHLYTPWRKRIVGSYRNYYCTNGLSESWEELVKIDLAAKYAKRKSEYTYYYVTDKAIELLKGGK